MEKHTQRLKAKRIQGDRRELARGVRKLKSRRSHGCQGSWYFQEQMKLAVSDSPPRSGVANTRDLTKEMSLSITEGSTGGEKPNTIGEDGMSHRRDTPFTEPAGNEMMM